MELEEHSSCGAEKCDYSFCCLKYPREIQVEIANRQIDIWVSGKDLV